MSPSRHLFYEIDDKTFLLLFIGKRLAVKQNYEWVIYVAVGGVNFGGIYIIDSAPKETTIKTNLQLFLPFHTCLLPITQL